MNKDIMNWLDNEKTLQVSNNSQVTKLYELLHYDFDTYVGTSEKVRLLEKMEVVEQWYMLVTKAKFAGTLCACSLCQL